MKNELKHLKTFEQKTFEEHSTGDKNTQLDSLLQKRFNYLKRFSDKEQKDGYDGLRNLRIEDNSIIFDNNVKDCRYDDKYFYVVGNEGEEKVELKGDYLKEIKKRAKNVNCGGLK